MQLIIRLLSDLCTCSGDTHNSLVDTDVVYDENGIPYIPAKRIKGCIREVAQEMVELGIADAEMHEIFGKEGQQRNRYCSGKFPEKNSGCEKRSGVYGRM